MRISDWSSDVCSSDLYLAWHERRQRPEPAPEAAGLTDYGIDSVALNGATTDVPVSVAMGDTLDDDVRVRSNDARAPVVLIGLVRDDGTPVSGVSSELDGARLTALVAGRFGSPSLFPALSLNRTSAWREKG